MKVGVWRTGHEIADTVADAIYFGLSRKQQASLRIARMPFSFDDGVHVAYGILRGAAQVFSTSEKDKKPWFNIDKGYWKPGHYDGYYRISLRGTQQTIGLDKLEPGYERWRALGIEVKPWRGFDKSKPILFCPPTEPVKQFFNIRTWDIYGCPACGEELRYIAENIRHCCECDFRERYMWRIKGDSTPINFDDYSHVITFNSSVGWQALAAGIPCISDPVHSMVGAWFKNFPLEELEESQYKDRERLFASMSSLQLTLNEIREGKLWDVMCRLISISGSIPESQSHPT